MRCWRLSCCLRAVSYSCGRGRNNIGYRRGLSRLASRGSGSSGSRSGFGVANALGGTITSISTVGGGFGRTAVSRADIDALRVKLALVSKGTTTVGSLFGTDAWIVDGCALVDTGMDTTASRLTDLFFFGRLSHTGTTVKGRRVQLAVLTEPRATNVLGRRTSAWKDAAVRFTDSACIPLEVQQILPCLVGSVRDRSGNTLSGRAVLRDLGLSVDHRAVVQSCRGQIAGRGEAATTDKAGLGTLALFRRADSAFGESNTLLVVLAGRHQLGFTRFRARIDRVLFQTAGLLELGRTQVVGTSAVAGAAATIGCVTLGQTHVARRAGLGRLGSFSDFLAGINGIGTTSGQKVAAEGLIEAGAAESADFSARALVGKRCVGGCRGSRVRRDGRASSGSSSDGGGSGAVCGKRRNRAPSAFALFAAVRADTTKFGDGTRMATDVDARPHKVTAK